MADIILISIILTVFFVIIGKAVERSKKNKALLNVKSSYAKFPYVSEINIVREMGYNVSSGNDSIFPSSTVPEEVIQIKVYRDAEESLADYKTFDFDYINKTNPLLEKELFRQLEKVLQAHGMTRIKEEPQFVISMDFFIGKKEYYTPPNTVTSTEMQYVWNTGMIGWNVGGFTSAVPITKSVTTPGYTTVSYYSNIRLNFLNHAKLVKGEKLEVPPLIWIGEAATEGSYADIRLIAPAMFNELVGEFPEQSAKDPNRFLRRFRYGGLGLGFDPSDWRIIRYVEPSSVAVEHGIKPGDVLIKINGKNPSRSFTILKDPSNCKDPYLQDVLSNRGDSDVELVIRSVETGKKIKLKVRPRSEDRYA